MFCADQTCLLSKNTSKEPKKAHRNYSGVRCHRTPLESSRRPNFWHQRWYNTVLIKHKYMSAIAMASYASVCGTWKAITEDGGASQALLALGAPTVSHSHMEAFFFLSHAPSGLTKAATTTYTALGTLFSIFYKAGPKSGPLQTQQSPTWTASKHLETNRIHI